MKILIAGSSGLVGTALIERLKNQHEMIKLKRCGTEHIGKDICWDPISGIIEKKNLEGIDAVVNLAGDGIASGRWTPKKKKKIWDSRIHGTSNLCRVLAELDRPPKILVNASAIGYYGDVSRKIDETAPQGNTFLASVCHDWEQATRSAEEAGIRVIKLRIGIVLSSKGGVLKKMLLPFKCGLGGRIGSGNQYMSWIALDDLTSIIEFCLVNDALKGPINAVAPHPVTNKEFTKILGQTLHRPTLFPVPALLIRFLLGEMGEELLLSGANVVPKKLIESGFTFKEPFLQGALALSLSST